MPNKNYIKGRRKEYKTINDLKARGFDIAFRSAGSHSPIDVVGIHQKDKVIFLLQCKPESMSENKRDAIRDSLNYLNGDFKVYFDVI